MRRPEFMRLIRSAALIAALLLAQAVAASHVEFADSHPAGECCAVCVGHSVLGTGNVGGIALPQVAVVAAPPVPAEQASRQRIHRAFFLARGPPTAS